MKSNMSNVPVARFKLSKRERTVGRKFVTQICEQFLAEGLVDVAGKSDEQALKELFDCALNWSGSRPMLMAIDHRPSLLRQARLFARGRSVEIGLMFYATWFEHWINGILTRKMHALDERQRLQMLREPSLTGKFTWVLALVHGVHISALHLKTIARVAELRNAFVHYKFVMEDVDAWQEGESEQSTTLVRVERTVKYLRRLERRLFSDGRKRHLVRKLKERELKP
jgi:hypothetical protein